jgi:hypothetical protein
MTCSYLVSLSDFKNEPYRILFLVPTDIGESSTQLERVALMSRKRGMFSHEVNSTEFQDKFIQLNT